MACYSLFQSFKERLYFKLPSAEVQTIYSQLGLQKYKSLFTKQPLLKKNFSKSPAHLPHFLFLPFSAELGDANVGVSI
jgi:hypothetical protein